MDKNGKEIKCTREECPINKISTSAGVPIKEKSKFLLKNGCYEYGCRKYDEKDKKCLQRKKQCLVGGGKP